MYPHSNLDMASAVKSVVSELAQTMGGELRWKMRSILEKSKSSRPKISKKKFKTVRSLRLNKDIKIVQADVVVENPAEVTPAGQ
jgi:ribosomal protein L30/L7E